MTATATGLTPLIEVIVPVHTPTRPIARAVGSVLAADSARIHVTVICHGVQPALIAQELGEAAMDPRVRLVALSDGIPSPAGPLNEGVRVSIGSYLTFLGSDDAFAEGALMAWEAELVGAPDILIGQLVTETGGRILAPTPRIGRFHGLNASRDMLNYRSAPVAALFARELLVGALSPRFLEGARTGEDLGLGLVLWNTAQDIRYSQCAVGYFGYESGDDRVTHVPLPPNEIQEPVRAAVRLEPLQRLPRRKRQAIAVKLLRHQVLYWLQAAARQGKLDEATIAEAAESVVLLRAYAPGAIGYFHRFDAAALAAVERRDIKGFHSHVQRGSETAFRWKVIPHNPLRVFAPENAAIQIRRVRAIPATLVEPALQESEA